MAEQNLSISKPLARRALLVGTSSLALSGCFGSFAAFNALKSWNSEVGGKWVNWLVFLGLVIIPVYELFWVADILVLNSLEFWTGKNPLAKTADGRMIARHATDDPRTVRVEVSRDGRVECVAYFRRMDEEHLQLLDEHMQLVTEVRGAADGSLALSSARGEAILQLAAGDRRAAEARISEGRSAALALGERVSEAREHFARAQSSGVTL
jgi:Domain of unknown function (DUF3332)